MHPLPHLHHPPAGCYSRTPAQDVFDYCFSVLRLPSVPLMSAFRTSTNRVHNAPPSQFASVRLALLMRGGSRESLQLRYISFLCRGVAAGPGASAWKVENVSKSTISNCSGRLEEVSWIPLGVGWAPSSQHLLVHRGSWKE